MAWYNLFIAAVLASCCSQPGQASGSLRQLTSSEIGTALKGKLVLYAPPGFADAGIHEEYHGDGRWAGIRYGRGPLPFAGRWKVQKNQLCVQTERGLSGGQWERGWWCRKVWKDTSGKLLMMHLTLGESLKLDLMKLSVRQLPK